MFHGGRGLMQRWLERALGLHSIPKEPEKPKPAGMAFSVILDLEKKKVTMMFPELVAGVNLDENEAERLALILIRRSTLLREMKRDEAQNAVPKN